MAIIPEYLRLMKNQEDFTLQAAGFRPTEEGTMWRRDGVWFGREAALQNARKQLRANDEDAAVEEPYGI